jgi:type IV secretory pathway VirB10-like protein
MRLTHARHKMAVGLAVLLVLGLIIAVYSSTRQPAITDAQAQQEELFQRKHRVLSPRQELAPLGPPVPDPAGAQKTAAAQPVLPVPVAYAASVQKLAAAQRALPKERLTAQTDTASTTWAAASAAKPNPNPNAVAEYDRSTKKAAGTTASTLLHQADTPGKHAVVGFAAYDRNVLDYFKNFVWPLRASGFDG